MQKSNSDKAHDESADTPVLDTVFTEQVWEDFFPRLALLARKRLGNVPRRAVDEEDVALSAINSFFSGMKAGRFQIQERDELWRLLSTIAARKVTRHQRKYFSQKRGDGKVRGESAFQPNGATEWKGIENVKDLNQMPEIPDRVFETCEDLLSKLPNEKLRATALMRMQGYSNQEISERLNCSVARTKQRIASIKKRWINEADKNED